MAVASAATSWVQSRSLGTAPGPAVEADWAGSAVETGSGRACCRGRVGLALLYGPRPSGSDVEAARAGSSHRVRHLPCVLREEPPAPARLPNLHSPAVSSQPSLCSVPSTPAPTLHPEVA